MFVNSLDQGYELSTTLRNYNPKRPHREIYD